MCAGSMPLINSTIMLPRRVGQIFPMPSACSGRWQDIGLAEISQRVGKALPQAIWQFMALLEQPRHRITLMWGLKPWFGEPLP